MNERAMTAILARAMRGDIGDALRLFIGQKIGEAVNLIALCNGDNAAFLAGTLRGLQIVSQGLEGMDVADRMMGES